MSEQENTRDDKGRFVKGASGNPNGRPPKGYSISEMFKEMLGTDSAKKKQLVDSILDKAIKGDINAAKLIWSYLDGKPTQTIETRDLSQVIASVESANNGFEDDEEE